MTTRDVVTPTPTRSTAGPPPKTNNALEDSGTSEHSTETVGRGKRSVVGPADGENEYSELPPRTLVFQSYTGRAWIALLATICARPPPRLMTNGRDTPSVELTGGNAPKATFLSSSLNAPGTCLALSQVQCAPHSPQPGLRRSRFASPWRQRLSSTFRRRCREELPPHTWNHVSRLGPRLQKRVPQRRQALCTHAAVEFCYRLPPSCCSTMQHGNLWLPYHALWVPRSARPCDGRGNSARQNRSLQTVTDGELR